MKISIRGRLFLILTSIILLFVILTQLFSSFFLEDFYLSSKKDSLRKSFYEIQELLNKEDKDFEEQLVNLQDRQNINVVITDNQYNDIFSLTPFRKISQKRHNARSEELIKNNIKFFQNEPFIVERFENRTNAQFLSLFANIQLKNDSKGYIVISSSIDAMNDSVDAASRFISYLSILIFVIGTIIIFFVSNTISEPIVKIGKITSDMADGDFSQIIQINSSDEIGDLAKNINFLSKSLSKTLNKLEIANRKLRKDIKQKEKIDESRKELIANISHELKTPISLIGGYAEGLKVNVNTQDKDYYCSVILDEAQKMNNLVLSLLDLSQVEAGYKLMKKEEFNVVDLIKKTLKRYKLKIKEKEIFLTELYDDNYLISADYDRIEQVLTNYLNNAINNIDDNRQVTIKATCREKYVHVSIFNTGKSIHPHQINKIWDSFYKLDKARTREYGGSGLGLSIVRAIIQAHGGKYGVNNCDNGVEFWFALPKEG